MKRKSFLIILLFIISFFLFSEETQITNILFIRGSNIYNHIFLFYFPIADKYNPSVTIEKNCFTLDIQINEDDLITEPSTPAYIESDLAFTIKDIPLNTHGIFKLPVTIRCNKQFITKKVDFTIYNKTNILILKGYMKDLYIKELTENEYFKKRFKWKFPFYFDIRLQLE